MEGNPYKIKVVLDTLPPSNIEDIQRLIGRIVVLSRFVSRAGEKCRPFFSGSKKGLPVGFTLPGGVHDAQNLSDLSPHSGKPFQGRTPHSLPGCFRLCN